MQDRQRLPPQAEQFQPLLTLWSVVAMQWPAFCVSLCFLWGSVTPSTLLSPPLAGAEGKERTSSSNSIDLCCGIFHYIWKILSHYFFKYFFSLPSVTPITCMLGHLKLSQGFCLLCSVSQPPSPCEFFPFCSEFG